MPEFSINALHRVNPRLAEQFIWNVNVWVKTNLPHLHIGCGERVLNGFTNVDFIPINPSVVKWNLLDSWPDTLRGWLFTAFCEDVLEHFYFNEQVYILCAMNVALRSDGVFRILMPDLHQLAEYYRNFDPTRNSRDWLLSSSGLRTAGDAFNLGMRMGGHRWLHDTTTLQEMASSCGFETVITPCAQSTVPNLSNINLRSETTAMSFAADLVKRVALSKWVVSPARVINAVQLEQVANDATLHKATNDDPQIEYLFPGALAAHTIVCMFFRFANLSQFNEHNCAKVYFKSDEAHARYFDSSLRSTFFSNIMSYTDLSISVSHDDILASVRLDPGEVQGDYFVVGPLEIFYR